MKSHDIKLICTGVSVPDFFSFSKDERRFLTGAQLEINPKATRLESFSQGAPTKPYHLAFQDAIGNAAKWTQELGRPGLKVNFIFEEQHQFEAWATMNFKKMKASLDLSCRDHIGSLVFGSNKDYPSLQVADLAAHLVYKSQRHTSHGIDLFAEAVGERIAYNGIWEKDKMRELLDKSIEPSFRHLLDWTGSPTEPEPPSEQSPSDA